VTRIDPTEMRWPPMLHYDEAMRLVGEIDSDMIPEARTAHLLLALNHTMAGILRALTMQERGR
jgi:hypothetical protein